MKRNLLKRVRERDMKKNERERKESIKFGDMRGSERLKKKKKN